MCENRLFIAAAGSGKTSLIVKEVSENTTERVLITTFTLANEGEIRKKLMKANKGVIPPHITVQTWFSFLLEHGIRPYRYWDDRVSGLQLVSTKSGLRGYAKNKQPYYWGEADFIRHFFSSNMDVYSDKISKLAIRCNEHSQGKVVLRLEKIYNHIYVDEVQDMAGWDLEIIKLFMESNTRITMVGDPRQTVYSTHDDQKYSKYEHGNIKEFITTECRASSCVIDEDSLNTSYRNMASICELSSKLYPDMKTPTSKLIEKQKHMGLFFVREQDVESYYKLHKPLQLRLRKDRKLLVDAPAMNFGESKGLEEAHILIYPTGDMLKWLSEGNTVLLKEKTKAQLYVALTRAKFSVAIIVADNFTKRIEGFEVYKSS